MRKHKISTKLLSLLLSALLALPLTVQNAYGAYAVHSFGNGAGGADYCTIWNYYYNQNTIFGPNISSHLLTYDGVVHDAFCLNPYLSNGSSYTSTYSYSQGYGADIFLALKYIAMYNDGYPAGDFTDQQRKIATQLAIFQSSQMGVDYAPPYKSTYWFIVMFGEYSAYTMAMYSLIVQSENYTMPGLSASLDTPENISYVHLTYNSDNNRYEATVNAGANAQYYSWSGYATRRGNYITFSVPASDISSWTETYNGCPAYTSGSITGTGPYTRVSVPYLWTAGTNLQPLLTLDYDYVAPTNTIQYSLYVDGMDEGRPGGGGGFYGGSIATDNAIAGGGSGYVGNSSYVASGNTVPGSDVSQPVPDGSQDGYARIVLLS